MSGFAVVTSILAIVFGFVGKSQINKAPYNLKGKGLAIAGLVLGFVHVGIIALALLLVLFWCYAYVSAMNGNDPCSAGAAAVACNRPMRRDTRPWAVKIRDRTWWTALGRSLLAHHPEGPAFQRDVFQAGDVRLCVGCLILIPSYVLAFQAFTYVAFMAPWWLWMASGFTLGSAQFVSVLGLTKQRSMKIAVKSLLGVGLAVVVQAALASPWSLPTRGWFFAGLLVTALLTQLPRTLRIRRLERESHAWTPLAVG